MSPIAAIVFKDIAIEYKNKEVFSSMLLFGILVVVVFSFAFEAADGTALEALLVPGMLWVAYSFAGILGLNRSLSMETDNDCLQGLLLSPLSRSDLYLGKVAGNFVFTIIAELILLPFFIMLNNLKFDGRLLWIVGITLLGTLGFVAIGTTLSLISAQTRMKEVMLPVLQIPMTFPVILSAVQAMRMVMTDNTDGISFPLSLLGVFSTVYLAASYVLFEYLVEE
jgi:heme exporter protein B